MNVNDLKESTRSMATHLDGGRESEVGSRCKNIERSEEIVISEPMKHKSDGA